MCGFPTVLKKMNDNLDWTQDLGNAFLGQEAELLDAVQRMRQKAVESGNLKTTEQQTVTQDDTSPRASPHTPRTRAGTRPATDAPGQATNSKQRRRALNREEAV
jgi:hypothetical protein